MTRRPPSEPDARPDSLWGGPKTALAALLVGAAALRLTGIRYGLPFPSILNPDEENIVPRAWAMVHGAGPDPHPFFDYPSLLLYLLAPLQDWHDDPSYLTARVAVAVLGVAGVAAAWWLGARAYGTVAGAIAAATTAVATAHVAYSHMAVTDVLLTLGITVSLALLVSNQVELAGLAAGFAMGAKYPAILLLVPIAVVAWGRWRRLGLSAVLLAAGFVASTPYVVSHPGEAWGDARRVQDLARGGWLGFEDDHAAPVAFVDRLWENIGPVLVVAAIGLALALLQRRPQDRVLAAFAVAYFVTLLPLDAHFDRYVLPLIPVLGALAGRLRSLAPVTLLLLVVPLAWSIKDDRELTRTDTRVAAARWLEQNVPPSATVAAEPSTAVPLDRVVRITLPRASSPPDPNLDLGRLRAQGVGFVVVSGAVGNRVRAAAEDYPSQIAFYDALAREAERAFHLEPGGAYAGPWVTVYRLR